MTTYVEIRYYTGTGWLYKHLWGVLGLKHDVRVAIREERLLSLWYAYFILRLEGNERNVLHVQDILFKKYHGQPPDPRKHLSQGSTFETLHEEDYR